MTSQFDLKTTSGVTITSIQPLESNGLGNLSTPREVFDIQFQSPVTNGKDAIVVSGDTSLRFVQGFVFNLLNTGYAGTYTVSDGASPAGTVVAVVQNGLTYIPISGGLQTPSFPIIGVQTGSNGTFQVAGVTNPEVTFLPGLSFAVTGNAYASANTSYTVSSSEASGVYQLTDVQVGSNNVTVAGDVVRFFTPGSSIVLRGFATGNGDGIYVVSSATTAAGNTTITFTGANTLPVGAVAGQVVITPLTPVAIITVQQSVLVGTTASGVAHMTTPVVLQPAAPTTVAGTADPKASTVVYSVPGDVRAALTVGTPFMVKHVSVGGVTQDLSTRVDSVSFVSLSSTYPQGLTQIATTYRNSIAAVPEIITGTTSRVVYPVSSTPFGQVQYTLGTDTPLKLVGRGSTGFNATTSWGQALIENSVHITENFANSLPPQSPLKGMTWFDTATPSLRVVTDTGYKVLSVVPGTHTITLDGQASNVGVSGDQIYLHGNSVYAKPTTFTISTISDIVTPATTSGHTTMITVSEAIDSAASTVAVNMTSPLGYAINAATMKGVVAANMAVQGDILMNSHGVKQLADPTADTDAISRGYADTRYVNVTGDTMSGALTLPGYPTTALHAATKQYVDDHVNGIIWITPIVDPNLFDDSRSAPPVPDQYTTYHRTYIVNGVGTGAWSGFNGHAMYYDGTNWKSVLGRAVQVGDRFGVYIEPDDDDTLAVPTAGGLAGRAGKIVTLATVSPYTYTEYTPTEPDAITVKGTTTGSSPHYGHSYTFRGTWGTGAYGTNYRWIEFSGPQMLVDGAGLHYTANILNVGAGTGITVGTDTVALDTTYTDGRYLKLSGGTVTGNLTVGGVTAFAGSTVHTLSGKNFFSNSGTLTYIYTDTGGIQWTNQANTTSLMTLSNTGNLAVTGTMTLSADPTLALQAATKQYVDSKSTLPLTSQIADYTLVLSDANSIVYHPVTDSNNRTFTIPSNTAVAFPIGTRIIFDNDSANVVSIAITTDTLALVGAGTTGTRTLAANGRATAIKVTATRWRIDGTGLS